MTADKIISRIRKLMAHAESAKKIGNEEEAQTFAAKVNELCLKHKLEMSDTEMQEANENDLMGETRVEGQATHSTRRRAKRRVKWQEDLASIVARAHFCRILISQSSNDIWFVGRESDREIAAWMYKYLVEQINKIGPREWRRYRAECRKLYGHQRAARGFLISFNPAFVATVSKRYRAEREAADLAAKAMSNSMALVRATSEVVEYMKKWEGGRGLAGLRGQQGGNAEGLRRGVVAGNRANIRANVVGEGNS